MTSSPNPLTPSAPSPTTSPAPSLARPVIAKRSVRQPSFDPLLGGAATDNSSPENTSYAVYGRKRPVLSSNTFDTPSTSSTAPPSSPGGGTNDSTPSTPPFVPSSTVNPPPLISRPSNSSLPAPYTRAPARSISEARSKLLEQALKAEVQSLGLGNESAGAAMVQKLSSLSGKEQEWSVVINALSSGKATLLLPAEKIAPTTVITHTSLLDHIVLFESEAVGSAASSGALRGGFATLSGIRGTVGPDELVFSSCSAPPVLIRGFTPLDLTDPDVQRTISGAAYPSPPSTEASSTSAFPSAMIISPLGSLSIPRTPSSTPTPPTLGRSSASSRLAALFAKVPAAADDLPPIVAAPPGLLTGEADPDSFPTSPPTSDSATGSKRSQLANLDVPVLAIGKIIRYGRLSAAITKALDTQLREGLRRIAGADDLALVERVCSFASRFQPSVAASTPTVWTSIEEMADSYQDMSDETRGDLGRTLRLKLVQEKEALLPEGSEEDVVLGQEDYVALEERVDKSLEAVEELITSLLYDRMFAPMMLSRDGQEDENLGSRIEALNALGVSLEHLGIELGGEDGSESWSGENRTIQDSLEEIVEVVGKELKKIQEPSSRSPRAKLAIFVNLHKIVVERLSELPPVPLKKETSTDSTANNGRPTEVEMNDAVARPSSSRTSSRPASPPLPAVDDETLLRTPRPPTDDGSSVPAINLSEPSSDISASVDAATSSSLFDPASPDPSTTTPSTPTPTTPKPTSPPSSSADLILPILIYSVIQSNPRLISHLHFAQRFRSESLLRGEASYCVTNIQAVIEFLNHVDISSLGLSSNNILSSTSTSTSNQPSRSSSMASLSSTSGRKAGGIRAQEIDQFVDSANHALVNVVDLLFGPKGFAPKTIEDVKNVLDGAGTVASKARGSLLRRTTASGEGAFRVGGGGGGGEGGAGKQREMVDFVPGSGDALDLPPPTDYGSGEKSDDDAKSVRSISSILRESSLGKTLAEKRNGGGGGGGGSDAGSTNGGEERPSLGERLANMSISGLGRFGSEGRQQTGSVSGSTTPKNSRFSFNNNGSPQARRSTNASLTSIGAVVDVEPVQRFLECEVEDLRMSEVGELLAEYRKLAAALVVAREGSGWNEGA